MNKALTIAGSDSGGGAGIQADLKTFCAFGVYGMAALTALTAQNTLGVQGIFEIVPEFVTEQIKSIMSDMGTDAAKTGMLANETLVTTVAKAIESYHIPNLVVDPVMIAKGGEALLSETARQTIKEQLIPLATVVTPNLYEAEILTGEKIRCLDDMKAAAEIVKKSGCQWVVLKGGHLLDEPQAVDVVYDGNKFNLLIADWIQTRNTHGTGCTFSAAIAAGLAKGYTPLRAIRQAKKYISEAIRNNPSIGQGHGPTNHFVGTETLW